MVTEGDFLLKASSWAQLAMTSNAKEHARCATGLMGRAGFLEVRFNSGCC
jgi:hypothetical protein